MSDVELKRRGLNLLINHLGEVDAEKFISLMNKEAYDYTEWQKNLFAEMDVKQLSQSAMEHRIKNKK